MPIDQLPNNPLPNDQLSNHQTQFTIGSDVMCGDGECGQLRRVVVDPVARRLTHLVVDGKRGEETGAGRLVPIALADVTADGIVLRCTSEQFEQLEFAEETQFVSGARGEWDYDQDHLMSWPYYGLGMAGVRTDGSGAMADPVPPSESQIVTYERVPSGEVQIRRGEKVHAADGDIGRVQGLVVDAADQAVTHVLLDDGHLWGKKRVAIPIRAVSGVGPDGVSLSLTKDEVRDLAPVDVDS